MARVYVLTSQSIFRNLAVEERLLHKAASGSLVLYSNSACVVLGRNQNPWKECNLPYLHREGITLARRNSGGGTVYHDLGNLCYSFLSSKEKHDKDKNTRLILKSLREELGLAAEMNERNDVLVDSRKVSGAAYRISKQVAYHHGTLLVRSDLDKLERSITSPLGQAITSKATESVRSKVLNLADKIPRITVRDVRDAVETTFRREWGIDAETVFIDEQNLLAEDRVEEDAMKKGSWVFGQTPAFSMTYRMEFKWGEVNATFSVNRGGSIKEALLQGPPGVKSLHHFGELLRDVEFGGMAISETLFKAADAASSEKHFILDVAKHLSMTVPNPWVDSLRPGEASDEGDIEPLEI